MHRKGTRYSIRKYSALRAPYSNTVPIGAFWYVGKKITRPAVKEKTMRLCRIDLVYSAGGTLRAKLPRGAIRPKIYHVVRFPD